MKTLKITPILGHSYAMGFPQCKIPFDGFYYDIALVNKGLNNFKTLLQFNRKYLYAYIVYSTPYALKAKFDSLNLRIKKGKGHPNKFFKITYSIQIYFRNKIIDWKKFQAILESMVDKTYIANWCNDFKSLSTFLVDSKLLIQNYLQTVLSCEYINANKRILAFWVNTGTLTLNIYKIFQRFFTTKPTGQGIGLGLSLSYDIIKTHGGEIKVTTKENEGTEFIIQLPIN